MKKQALLRALLGFPLGVFLSYTITLLVASAGPGKYAPVVPQLAAEMGGEMPAIWFQYALSGLLGAVCAAASVVWNIDTWGILRQTAVHMSVLFVSLISIAYALCWMERSLAGAAAYLGILLASYAIVWVAIYFPLRRRIRRINERVKRAGGQ